MGARIITPDFSQSQGSFLDAPGQYKLVRGVRVSYSERLKEYLANQKDKDILISAYKPHGHMAVAELNIHQVSEARANALLDGGMPYIIGEVGRVLITNTWIPTVKNAVIELDLSSWLGVKSITAKGLKHQDVLQAFAPIINAIDDR